MTRSLDLVAEYLAAFRRMRVEDVLDLIDVGVPIRAITAACPAPCLVRLVDEAGELYEPDADDGAPAYILPATAVDPAWPELLEALDPREGLIFGAIVDLVACHPQSPRHALRTGQALTLGAIEHQYWNPAPVRVHRTVNAWLRAECTGIVLLTRDPHEAGRVLREIAVIEAEDRAHAAELQRLLHMPTTSTVITGGARNE